MQDYYTKVLFQIGQFVQLVLGLIFVNSEDFV
jgi:hypothetical protein